MNKPYEKMAKYYDVFYRKLENEREVGFLHNIFRQNSASTVLDVGCGTGRHALHLAKLGYKVTALDVSSAMLSIARHKGRKLNIKFVRADVTKIDFSVHFDAIVCLFNTFNYILSNEDQEKTLQKFYVALKPGGVLVIDISNPRVLLAKQKKTDIVIGSDKNISYMQVIKNAVALPEKVLDHREFDVVNENGKVISFYENHKLKITDTSRLVRNMRTCGFKKIRVFDDFSYKKAKMPERFQIVGFK